MTIGSGRRLIPTTLGGVLVHGYQKIDAELVLPTMRSDVEKALNLIAAGSADFNAVLKHAIEIFRMKFLFFVQNICVMDSLFESSFASIADSGKAFSRCGKCRRYMKYIQTKPARLHCTQCNDTYTLPKDGTVRWVMKQRVLAPITPWKHGFPTFSQSYLCLRDYTAKSSTPYRNKLKLSLRQKPLKIE